MWKQHETTIFAKQVAFDSMGSSWLMAGISFFLRKCQPTLNIWIQPSQMTAIFRFTFSFNTNTSERERESWKHRPTKTQTHTQGCDWWCWTLILDFYRFPIHLVSISLPGIRHIIQCHQPKVKPMHDIVSRIDLDTGNSVVAPCMGKAYDCHSIYRTCKTCKTCKTWNCIFSG